MSKVSKVSKVSESGRSDDGLEMDKSDQKVSE
jgi:hypothetical protein